MIFVINCQVEKSGSIHGFVPEAGDSEVCVVAWTIKKVGSSVTIIAVGALVYYTAVDAGFVAV